MRDPDCPSTPLPESKSSLQVILTGASSQLGKALLQRLQGDTHRLTCLSRHPPRASDRGVVWRRTDLLTGWPQGLGGDVLISFGPLQALADALAGLQMAPVQRIIATSSMSALSKRESSVPEDRILSQALRDAEAALIEQCERLGIGWTLLRPTMIYGMGMDRNLTPIADRAMRLRLFPYPAGRGLRQPVHARDVAEAAWRAVGSGPAHGRCIEIGGGERLRIDRMFARVRASLGVPTLAVPVPRLLLRATGALLPRWRGAISRIDQDLTADNTDLEMLLGIRPLAFAPTAASWRVQ